MFLILYMGLGFVTNKKLLSNTIKNSRTYFEDYETAQSSRIDLGVFVFDWMLVSRTPHQSLKYVTRMNKAS